MFAVIKSGGKQYRVSKDSVIKVEKLAGVAGDTISFDDVLMIGDEDGTKVGAPTLAGAVVEAELLEQGRGPKLIIFKKKRRKNYRRRNGHRQDLTILRITEIRASASKKKAAAKKKAPADAVDAEPAEAAAAQE